MPHYGMPMELMKCRHPKLTLITLLEGQTGIHRSRGTDFSCCLGSDCCLGGTMPPTASCPPEVRFGSKYTDIINPILT